MWHTFPNVGYIMADLTEEQLKPIKDEIAEIQSDFSKATPHNYNLSGHIAKEYTLFNCRQHVEDISIELAHRYINEFPIVLDDYYREVQLNLPLRLGNPWVNFQKKYEFNPVHKHGGVLSFVIWIKLPYKISEEYERYPAVPGQLNSTACFGFHYTDSLGNIQYSRIPADCKYEGKIMLFSNLLRHSVNPFYTSDDYRISVAGNLQFVEN